MRSHAKASSAASTQRQATRLGCIVRGALAGRGASNGADGSGAPSPHANRLAIGVLVTAFVLLVLAPGAAANITTRAQTGSFGADGTAFSSFEEPDRLAFDQANEKLYVFNDTAAPAIHAFEVPGLVPVGGNFPLSVPDPGFSGSTTVDNTGGATAGRIYYTGFGLGLLEAYDSTGTAVGAPFPISPPAPKSLIDVAVDSQGNIAIGNNNTNAKNVLRYDSDGTQLASVSISGQGIGRANSVAFDSNDNLYVTVTFGSTEVYRYDAPGYTTSTPIQTGATFNAIAVDTSSDTLYTVHESKVGVFDAATGVHLYDFARNIAGANLQGIAIDQATDVAYVSDAGNDKVYAFGPDQSFADATGTPVAATEITDESAVIDATVADNSVFPTAWRLEISSDGGESWQAVKSGTTASKSATITATGPSIGTLTVKAGGGTYKLGFEGEATSAISYNASANSVRTALEGLTAIEPGDVEVSGGPGSASGSTPYTIIFTGALSGTAVTQIGIDPLNLIGGPEAVSATASGLDPNTAYRFRVVTNKGLTAATEVASFALSFKTVAPPPVVTDIGSVQVADTSARLVGTVDPRNSETGYVFRYGTTAALGSTTPPLAVGSGTEPITVSQVVGGLEPDTTYYFKLVATNLVGETTSSGQELHTRSDPFPPADSGNCPNEALRQEQGSTHLPDCRAYEMVSPPDKNQGSAVGSNGLAAFSEDGTGAFFCSSTIFGEPAGQQSFTCSPNISRRGPDGWVTQPAGPRYCNVDPDVTEIGGSAQAVYPSPGSFDHLAISMPEYESCPLSPHVAGAPMPSIDLFVQDLSTEPFSIDLLTPELRAFGGTTEGTAAFGGGSEDFSHFFYDSRTNQTADSPPQADYMKIYDWERQGHGDCVTPGGCLSLASKKPDGTPFDTASKFPTHDIYTGNYITHSAISRDGERVYFQNKATGGGFENSASGGCNTAACDLYMREGGETTLHVSASECTEECGVDSSPDAFRLANPGGDIAFFVSCAKLTDASADAKSCTGTEYPNPSQQLKLYRWDRSAPPGGRLVDLTVDHEPADGTQPKAMEVIGASDDGDVAYIVAAGQLVAGAPTESAFKLYRWRYNGGSPTLDYLAPYVSTWPNGSTTNAGESASFSADPNVTRLHTRVTPDGKYVLIQTVLPYNPAGDRDSDADLYRWDEGDGWICVSCQLPGKASAGDVNSTEVSVIDSFTNSNQSGVPDYTISDDGQRVFFETPDALVPEDINGEVGCPSSTGFADEVYTCEDAYEWHDGTVSLLTSGAGSDPFYLMGATASGDEVFFYTDQRLLGHDVDKGTDIYVARTGGGFPEPAPQPPECEGEACRGGTTVPAAIVGAGTAVFQGPGNPPAASKNRCGKGKLRRGKRCLSARAIARKRCRKLSGLAKRRCIRRQSRRLPRAQRRRAQRRAGAHRANFDRRAAR